jgi:hypothetical protein
MSSSGTPFVLTSDFWIPVGIILAVVQVFFTIYVVVAYRGKENNPGTMVLIFVCCGCLPAVAYSCTTVRPSYSTAHRSPPQPQSMSRDNVVSAKAKPTNVRLSVRRIESQFVSVILKDSPKVVPIMSLRLIDEDGACIASTARFGVRFESKGIVTFDKEHVGTFASVQAPCRVTIEIKLTAETESRNVNVTERQFVAVDGRAETLTPVFEQLGGMAYCQITVDDNSVDDAPTKPKREASVSTSSSASQSYSEQEYSEHEYSEEEYNSASDSSSDREQQRVQRVKSACFIARSELVVDHESNPRRATWKSLGLRVAITRMPSTSDAVRIECQDRIAIICSQLTAHSNVERLFGFTDLDKNTMAVITEHLGQETLESMLRDSSVTLSSEKQLSIAQACVRGLAHLHVNGIVHGDIRSANVKISEDKDDVIRIANFWRSDGTFEDDEERRVKWLAPELQDHEHSTSLEGDVFALGGLLFEIFVRETPFGDVSNSKAVARLMRGKRAEIPTHVQVPSLVRDVMDECWKQEPKERPTVTQLMNRFE